MPATLVLAALLLAGTAAADAPPDARGVIEKMRAALEPPRASTRKVTIVLNAVAPQTESLQLVAGQARKKLADGRRILTVVLAPEDARGIGLLVAERQNEPDLQWTYIPAVRRVRALVPADTYQSFLNTDFTYADLGFVDEDATYKLLGNETRDGTPAVKIEAVPRDQWYYSRSVIWIASDSSLPIRKEFYDPAGLLWKVETWGHVVQIDGTPIPLQVRMEDVRQGGSTELRVSDVLWDRELPDALFEPRNLPQAPASPVWSGAAR
jgi:hypothetical protein